MPDGNDKSEGSPENEAEALLRQLEVTMAMSRARRESGDHRRLVFRALGVVFLLVFTALLVWLLFSYAAQIPGSPPAGPGPEGTP